MESDKHSDGNGPAREDRGADAAFIDAEYRWSLPWQVVEGVEHVWTPWKRGRMGESQAD